MHVLNCECQPWMYVLSVGQRTYLLHAAAAGWEMMMSECRHLSIVLYILRVVLADPAACCFMHA